MKIFCIGRNYAEHAKEMNSAIPDAPVVFMKPPTSLVKPGGDFYYPDFTKNLHYECELVIRICKNGKSIDPQFAHKYYDQLTLGIDFTARDLQQICKDKKQPWEIAKAFDNSAPIGKLIPIPEKDINMLQFELHKNGKVVQKGNTTDLLFDIPTLISYISKFFTLQQGDLIFTGTPEGVGPVAVGDQLEAFLEGDKLLDLRVK